MKSVHENLPKKEIRDFLGSALKAIVDAHMEAASWRKTEMPKDKDKHPRWALEMTIKEHQAHLAYWDALDALNMLIAPMGWQAEDGNDSMFFIGSVEEFEKWEQ